MHLYDKVKTVPETNKIVIISWFLVKRQTLIHNEETNFASSSTANFKAASTAFYKTTLTPSNKTARFSTTQEPSATLEYSKFIRVTTKSG